MVGPEESVRRMDAAAEATGMYLRRLYGAAHPARLKVRDSQTARVNQSKVSAA